MRLRVCHAVVNPVNDIIIFSLACGVRDGFKDM